MRRLVTAAVLTMVLWPTAGCFQLNVDAGTPERREQPPDSSRVPPTRDHEHARQELERAYRYMRVLEHENDKLDKDKQKLKREKKEYKDYEDRYKDCMDDLKGDD